MGRLDKLKRQAIQESNKRNLGIINEDQMGGNIDDLEDDIVSLEDDMDSIVIPVEDEFVGLEDPVEVEVDPYEIPVEMLFNGIDTGDVSQVESGISQIDMPIEKESAILRFAKLIDADSYDLHRVADKLDLEL
tara:strand:- start:3334 stop:3732 length:399 start_codon:yes stop_codon:yes gene_type:complete